MLFINSVSCIKLQNFYSKKERTNNFSRIKQELGLKNSSIKQFIRNGEILIFFSLQFISLCNYAYVHITKADV